ncbi:MAG: PQQ-dependent sugar dehydrogenase [Roseiflexaceae bacterium]|nr:PQQ-dependent sugar dehydrogenase [Roseiflexaceae bacterium]
MRLTRALSALCLLALVTAGLLTLPAQAAVPPEFEAPLALFSVGSPTDIAFAPDGSIMFVTNKTGELDVATMSNGNPTLLPTPAIDLSARICTETERGLLGVAADPNFATNRYLYLYYTWDRGLAANNPNRCQLRFDQATTADTPVNRVVRFTLENNNQINPLSERILVDNIPSPGGHHNGGTLQFGTDGYLYITIGDGGCDYNGGVNSCDNSNDASRDQNILLGKVLRITPDPDLTPQQRIPDSNPFRATGTICAIDGRGPLGTPASTPCQETFAWGLRNPFRIAFDPNVAAPAVRFFIDDVGADTWEEINDGTAGADYRWNTCEGLNLLGTNTPCPNPVGLERNPIHMYHHNDGAIDPDTVGCGSITGGAFVPAGAWPAAYTGKYLFADYVCGKIFMIDANAPAISDRTIFANDEPSTSIKSIVDITFGPAPNGTALYFASINTSGIFRISLSNGSNRAPTAAMSANPLFGSRAVTFDGTASSDLDGDSLTYLWSFGNGDTRTTTIPTTSYTYPNDGVFNATLQVRDSNNAISLNTATVRIDTGNTPPVVTITGPAVGATFRVGQTITLQGSANDAEDGTIPDTALRWEVLRHHRAGQIGEHTHPWFGPQNGNNLTFTAPAPEDLDAANNSYLEIRLTATDLGGGSATVIRNFLPSKVNLTFVTIPAGLKIQVNGLTLTTPQTIVSWENYGLDVLVPPQFGANNVFMGFSSWADSADRAQRTIVTPAAATTYTATLGPIDRVDTYLSLVVVP